jgi:hypothetical protein
MEAMIVPMAGNGELKEAVFKACSERGKSQKLQLTSKIVNAVKQGSSTQHPTPLAN